MSITSLSLTKQHMRVDGAQDDELIQHYLDSAESWIQNHIGVPFLALEPLPADLKQAVLMLASHWFEQRENVLIGVSANEVPFSVSDILRAYRKWEF